MRNESHVEDGAGEISLDDNPKPSDERASLRPASSGRGLRLSVPSFFDNQDFAPSKESASQSTRSPTLVSQSSHNVLDIVLVEDRGHQDLMIAESSSSSDSTVHHTSTPDLFLSVKAVANRMRSSHVSTTQYERQFLPHDELRAITNEINVRRLLRTTFSNYNEETINDLVAEVLGRRDLNGNRRNPPRRKIFGILIMMEQIQFLELFIKGDTSDGDLPLEIRTVDSNDTESVYQLCKRRPGFSDILDSPDFLNSSKILSTSDHLDPVKCLDGWSSQQMEYFVLHQKRICVPFFQLPGEQIKFYCLHDNPILPFMDAGENEQQPIFCGSGSVRKVKIHSAQYTHTGGGKVSSVPCRQGFQADDWFQVQEGINKYFAVKELRVATKQAHDNEVDIFKKIGLARSHSSPRHLIQLQFSYLLGDRYYLVFPWADGNLRQFWEIQPSPSPADWKQSKWFFTQCAGLVRALRKIHHVHSTTMTKPKETIPLEELNSLFGGLVQGDSPKEWGRHGDIKPENILWFQKHDGLTDFLVLSDFGLTSFNTADSRSKVHHDAITGFTGTYRPPEFDLQSEISQSYDVWSLGCVFLEFVSWFLLGFNQTEDSFTNWRGHGGGKHTWYSEDTFFVVDWSLRQAEVKPAVIDVRTTRICTLLPIH